ncbi:hypothetical protein ZWY2020_018501 [Hordeum vulgare]|nr:hypothetical protein ZWY2020_018501 [Hordeum vulgare]
MAERGEHCLVERSPHEGTDEKERLPDGDECLLRVTTFQVKYNDDGELVKTVHRRSDYDVLVPDKDVKTSPTPKT